MKKKIRVKNYYFDLVENTFRSQGISLLLLKTKLLCDDVDDDDNREDEDEGKREKRQKYSPKISTHKQLLLYTLPFLSGLCTRCTITSSCICVFIMAVQHGVRLKHGQKYAE